MSCSCSTLSYMDTTQSIILSLSSLDYVHQLALCIRIYMTTCLYVDHVIFPILFLGIYTLYSTVISDIQYFVLLQQTTVLHIRATVLHVLVQYTRSPSMPGTVDCLRLSVLASTRSVLAEEIKSKYK